MAKVPFHRLRSSATAFVGSISRFSTAVGLSRNADENEQPDVCDWDERGSPVDFMAYAQLLRQCGTARDLLEGKRLHARIARSKHHGDLFLENLVVQMYGKCGSVEDARAVFDKIQNANVYSWSIIITAYAQNGHLQDARSLLEKLPQPDPVSYNVVISACAQRGQLQEARDLFDRMPQRDVASWTGMIAAYTQNGDAKEAMAFFRRMKLEGVKSNEVTYVTVLQACGNPASLAEGRFIHASAFESGYQSVVKVGNALVTMYGSCGSPKDARSMFESMRQRNVVSWSTMVAAYAQNEQGRECLKTFRLMNLEGVKPNESTFASIFYGCGTLALLKEGRSIHYAILENGIETDAVVDTALLHMYGKCGSLRDARLVFDKMPQKSVIPWSAMIAAYTKHGHGKESLELFQGMGLAGIMPDDITFISVLSACSHGGLLAHGLSYFLFMAGDYGISPTLDHYVCMIDLLGRVGRLLEAEELIDTMPFEADVVSWTALVNACKIHGDVDRGARAAQRILRFSSRHAGPYVSLATIYRT